MLRHLLIGWPLPAGTAILLAFAVAACTPRQPNNKLQGVRADEWPWEAPDTASIPRTPQGDLIRYGRSLIAHTARYLGPQGIVKPISNGMNCQNCHLDAGTRPWGNNYSAVAATYPRYRERSGTIESVEKGSTTAYSEASTVARSTPVAMK